MRNLKTVTIFILLSIVISIPGLKTQESEDYKLFNEAMELRIQREWNQALEKYKLLKQKYPNSKYMDDADFWSAYILEEQGKEADAFKAYKKVQTKYPNSPWADDAAMHQIGLAEKFVRQGQGSYKRFLTEHLHSPNKNIKYQAALSLGKLGDNRAIPVLKEMSNNGDRDMRSVGNSLLRKLDRPTYLKPRDRSQRPMQSLPPKSRSDKKSNVIKPPTMSPKNQTKVRPDKKGNVAKPPTIKPKRQIKTPTRKPDIKINRPTQKQPPKRSTPPKTSPPKKKGKVGKFMD